MIEEEEEKINKEVAEKMKQVFIIFLNKLDIYILILVILLGIMWAVHTQEINQCNAYYQKLLMSKSGIVFTPIK
jgi:hypothetical protein